MHFSSVRPLPPAKRSLNVKIRGWWLQILTPTEELKKCIQNYLVLWWISRIGFKSMEWICTSGSQVNYINFWNSIFNNLSTKLSPNSNWRNLQTNPVLRWITLVQHCHQLPRRTSSTLMRLWWSKLDGATQGRRRHPWLRGAGGILFNDGSTICTIDGQHHRVIWFPLEHLYATHTHTHLLSLWVESICRVIF